MAKSNSHFRVVDSQVSFVDIENKILKYWQDNKIFEESIKSRPEDKTWTFLDGPPFITGMPHYGSLLSSIAKDIYPRYWTMKGYRVRRVWGWDCHGLPAENKVETKLGLVSKREIEEKVGVKKFIDECKLYVSEVSGEWEWYVNHIARWADFKNAYKTMDVSYMESVMWVFSELYKKELIYKGLRVSLYCPHCVTPISNFEVAMDADNYKEVTEAANTYKYKLKDEEDTFLLAWSTTPWNKIATPALAVNPKLTYIRVKQNNEHYILAKNTLKNLTAEKYEIESEFKGSDLVGKSFEPHYDFYEIEKDKKAFIVIPGNFVTEEEGTGIVTIAAYGEDDLKAMNEHNIQIVLHVDEEGHLKGNVPNWGGMYYLKVNKLVNEDLANRGLVYKEESYIHTVPTCWRCHTRLYYAPQDAWYVDIGKLRPQLEAQNEFVNWFPDHFKHGRFLNSVKSAPDWCISRSRYWGSPVPVWETPSGKRFVPGSIKELEELSGVKIKDLHKPEIDEVTIKDPETGELARRVPEVLDSWTEAGSASFAERHYPFEKANLEDFFPPDFISEYTGQIRAWFYVLHVIAVALNLKKEKKDNILSRNVHVTGVIKGSDGRKMSKNLGNYPDPKEMLTKYGGDALRLYLLGSPIMNGEDIAISEEEYKEQVRGFMLPLWNVYKFFITYASLNNWEPSQNATNSENVLDKWLVSRLNNLIKKVTTGLENYDSTSSVNAIREFIVADFSQWYVRRSRDRVGNEFYETTYNALVTLTKLLAPIAPFISEEIYQNLTGGKSVHLENWPEFSEDKINTKLEEEMFEARKIVELAHAERKSLQIPVRQPLTKLIINSPVVFSSDVQQIIADEVNVLKVEIQKSDEISIKLDTNIDENLKLMGEVREWTRKIQEERKRLGTALDEEVDVLLPVVFEENYLVPLKEKALVRNLSEGEFSVSRVSR